MNLNDVHRGIHGFRKKRRIGRGPGSGHGKTAGRGHKGQQSRAGWSRHPAFQGGTMPLVRRVPKRGFHNRYARQVAIVNVGDLEQAFAAGAEVTPASLRATPLLGHRYDELKVLGNGSLTKKLKVHAHRFSQSAVDKIEQAGGEVVRLPGPTPVAQKQQAKAGQSS
jgi:large subunit ribosomal protein L15